MHCPIQTVSTCLQRRPLRAFQPAKPQAGSRCDSRDGDECLRAAEAQTEFFRFGLNNPFSPHSMAQAKVPPVLIVSIP